MSYVYPTHKCFDDTVEFCERRARAKHPSVDTTLRLVHGIILTPADQPAGVSDTQPGDRTLHAWVEDGDLCWDFGILEDGRRIEFAVARAEYYEHYRVQETTVYTMRELLAANKASGHYGPWRPEYAALCRTPVIADQLEDGLTPDQVEYLRGRKVTNGEDSEGEAREGSVCGEVQARRRHDPGVLSPESAARRR